MKCYLPFNVHSHCRSVSENRFILDYLAALSYDSAPGNVLRFQEMKVHMDSISAALLMLLW